MFQVLEIISYIPRAILKAICPLSDKTVNDKYRLVTQTINYQGKVIDTIEIIEILFSS